MIYNSDLHIDFPDNYGSILIFNIYLRIWNLNRIYQSDMIYDLHPEHMRFAKVLDPREYFFAMKIIPFKFFALATVQ